jgi:hypothetical protein
MCEGDFAADLKRLIDDECLARCDDLPTENAAFVADLDSGERFMIIVQQVSE